MFDRFRRASAAVPGRLSCYGKLPLDREFLRFHLGSDEARRLVAWIDGAHHVIAASVPPRTQSSNVELRALLSHGGGRRAIAALIRPSSDGGMRNYPICVFAVDDAQEVRDQWHLTPLWVAPLWRAIGGNVLDASIPDRATFAAVLDNTAYTLEGVELLASRFADATRANLAFPWCALTGARPERARELAVTLVQLGGVQRAARRNADGVAVQVPLVASDALGAAFDGAMQAALWVRLFGAVSGCTAPWPAVVQVCSGDTGLPQSLCIFGREPTAEDLAHLLAGVGRTAIDDLNDPWDAQPSSGWGREALAGLLDDHARCLADLWEFGS